MRLFGGPPRKPEAHLTQREMDLARSVQEVTEEIMLRLARTVQKEIGCGLFMPGRRSRAQLRGERTYSYAKGRSKEFGSSRQPAMPAGRWAAALGRLASYIIISHVDSRIMSSKNGMAPILGPKCIR